MTWTADNVPRELLEIISDAADKGHKNGGEVAKNLADVLNAYDVIKLQDKAYTILESLPVGSEVFQKGSKADKNTSYRKVDHNGNLVWEYYRYGVGSRCFMGSKTLLGNYGPLELRIGS
jgi:hypothetical protein